MKVKDLSQPLLSGRMGNLIYYVRNISKKHKTN